MLFRASHHSASLEVELTRRNIPFMKFGGLKFLEAAHIKDVLAVLRWARTSAIASPDFASHNSYRNGPGSAARLLDRMAESANPIDALNGFRPPAAAAEHWQDFEANIGMLRRNVAGWPAELDSSAAGIGRTLNAFTKTPASRSRSAQLAQIASTYPSRERFLTELTLDPPDATSDQAGPLLDEDYLILSTIHSAKGQEWNAVFVLNTVDGCIPSDLGTGTTHEIEEERRLLYVAMTRAKDQLHVMVPQRFYTHGQRSMGDRHVYAQRTRFHPQYVATTFRAGLGRWRSL